MNREEMVRVVLSAGLAPMERRVMCACICLAIEDGTVRPDERLIAPMAGVRLRYVKPILKTLTEAGWLTKVSVTHVTVCGPQADYGLNG